MTKYNIRFQIGNGVWYRGGKIIFDDNGFFLCFLGKTLFKARYEQILDITKDCDFLLKYYVINIEGTPVRIAPGLFNRKGILLELRKKYY